jgi:NitT/TauT family transport system permease protein/taurine transport system permease protein
MSIALKRSLLIWATALLLWEALSRLGILSPVILPAPSMILGAAKSSAGEFVEGIQITLYEVLIATAIAVTLGTSLGALLGATGLGAKASAPILAALFAVPLITWYPLFMTWFGLGSASKIAYGVVSGIFPIAIGTIDGVSGVDRQRIVFGRSVGCSRGQLFTRIILPLALPSIITGMRIGIALCVIGVIVAEMLSSLGGVGYLISYHRTMFNTGHVYFSILIAIIFAYGVNRLLTFVERRFSAWRDTDP